MKFIIKKKQQPKTTIKYVVEGVETEGSGDYDYSLYDIHLKQYDANKQFCNLKLFGDYDLLYLLEVEMDENDKIVEYIDTIECWSTDDK